MRRRAFIAGLGGAFAWPLVARAQQAIPVIGFLSLASSDEYRPQATAFLKGLGEAGYVKGRDANIAGRKAE